MKVEVGRKLLREATADVRDAFREPVSLDTRPTVEREWLGMQVSKLATEILSPDAFKDLEAFGSSAESVGEMQPVDLTGWCPALGKPRVFHSPTGPTNADPF